VVSPPVLLLDQQPKDESFFDGLLLLVPSVLVLAVDLVPEQTGPHAWGGSRGAADADQADQGQGIKEADGDGDDSGNGKGPSTTTTTLTFSDSDCDDDDDNVSVVSSVLSRAEHYSLRQQRALSPSAAVLMAVLNENGSGGGDDGVGRTSRQQQHSGSRYSSSSRHRRKNHSAGAGVGVVSRRRLGGTAGRVRPTADMFATILLCSSDEAGNRFAKGMTMYKHIHSKITQDVCNAIFLCKVLL
jgi:hypothetical protein